MTQDTSVSRETLGDGSPVPDNCSTCWQRSEGYDQNDDAPTLAEIEEDLGSVDFAEEIAEEHELEALAAWQGITPSQLAPFADPLFTYDDEGHPAPRRIAPDYDRDGWPV